MFHSWETSTQKEGGERVGGKNRIMRGEEEVTKREKIMRKSFPFSDFFLHILSNLASQLPQEVDL